MRCCKRKNAPKCVRLKAYTPLSAANEYTAEARGCVFDENESTKWVLSLFSTVSCQNPVFVVDGERKGFGIG